VLEKTATITILLFLLAWTVAAFAIAWFIGEFIAAGRGWDSETKSFWAEKRRHDQEQVKDRESLVIVVICGHDQEQVEQMFRQLRKEQKAENTWTPDGTGERKVTNTVH
jgi:hypothetical protein